MTTTPRNTIRTFALICVAVSTAFVIGMGVWLTTILSGTDWCARAIGAGQVASRPETAISGCFTLLHDQVAALAWNSHIFAFVIALCLLVLMVIVIAGGHLSFRASKEGIEGDIGGTSEPAVAAARVAGAAVDEAQAVAQESTP